MARRRATALPTLLISIVLLHQTFEANLFVGGVPVALPLAVVLGFAVAAPDGSPASRSEDERTASTVPS